MDAFLNLLYLNNYWLNLGINSAMFCQFLFHILAHYSIEFVNVPDIFEKRKDHQ